LRGVAWSAASGVALSGTAPHVLPDHGVNWPGVGCGALTARVASEAPTACYGALPVGRPPGVPVGTRERRHRCMARPGTAVPQISSRWRRRPRRTRGSR
jgi:hypothetical protein